MNKEIKYFTERNGFMIKFYIITIFTSIIGMLFLGFDIEAIIFQKDVLFIIVVDTIFTVLGLFFVRMCKPVIMICGRSKFEITFYKDNFHYKGIMREETIRYEEMENISEVILFSGYGGDFANDKGVLKLDLKGRKKRLYITLGGLREENKDKLRMEFKNRTHKNIDLSMKWIFFIK
ncbi:hypothetical protein [Clostridium felsineum]|uniref:Uncharacterized protein n=1 Tax=Clostridium felsineum TaxID=36839 RepID=A0A1S8KZG3_9CLOT|nr:hypothetical protein [Clostridium felsineum]URZ07783.1 hypothetical protein CLROS_031440 [Clostridium felsineum]URZ12814.1 hypothetical protein CROST_035590 [Clostridium felsineum]